MAAACLDRRWGECRVQGSETKSQHETESLVPECGVGGWSVAGAAALSMDTEASICGEVFLVTIVAFGDW